MIANKLEVLALKYKQGLIQITMMDSNITFDESTLLTNFMKVLDEVMQYCRVTRDKFDKETVKRMIAGEYERIVDLAMRDQKLSFEENQLIDHIQKCLEEINSILDN